MGDFYFILDAYLNLLLFFSIINIFLNTYFL